jgi:hypothetical protein
MEFRLPGDWLAGAWSCVFDTAAERPFETRAGEICGPAHELTLVGHSMILARRAEAR